MFKTNSKYYLLYYINMSIINYKNKMMRPLWELERTNKLSYIQTHKNIIQERYWMFMKLYCQVLKWH